MYWSDADLFEWAQKGGITPFDPQKHTTWIGSKQRAIGPASIDLCLGSSVRELRRYEPGQTPVIDYNNADAADMVWKSLTHFGEYILEPGGAVLLTTHEMVRIPENAVGVLFLRSGAGRRALEHLHCLAGDTMIDVPRDMSVYPRGIAISELAVSGEEFDLYAFDEEEMRFVLTRGAAFQARSGAEMVRVSYEWVTGRELRRGSITCTPDHRLLTLRGEWVEAKDANGIRLRPFSRGFDEKYPWFPPYSLGGRIVRRIGLGQITTAYLLSGTLKGAAKMLLVSEGTLANEIRQNGFSGTLEFREAISGQSNHKVYSVERLPDPMDTYDICVPGYENFVANGVVVHNSGFADPGFPGELTLEVVNLSGVSWRLRPGDRLVQLAIADMKRTPINSYLQTGRYLEQHEATAFRPERERV